LIVQALRVNGYDMAYVELGQGRPLICVHGTLGDFRTFQPIMGPLSQRHRVIAVSLRHFFPEHWNGEGDDYKIAQHVADVIAFIEQIEPRPLDLMGHSRGGHIAFRVAQARPDLLRKLVLAEPGGELDATLAPPAPSDAAMPPSRVARIQASAEKVRAGDIDAALRSFYEGIEGEGKWARLPASAKQQLRDNAFTLLGQAAENRRPYSQADARSIQTPTLFIGGTATEGSLPIVLRALSAEVPGAQRAMIEGAGHWMFDRVPERYCEIVTAFLAG
jgi:pimeloyl-ACP methyl ester carboxylesterase